MQNENSGSNVPPPVNKANQSLTDIGGAGAERGEAAPASALPCLNTINCNKDNKNGYEKLSAGHRKTAFALKLNVLLMIGKYGLEKIGFLTLTFSRHVVAYRTAQKALHSLMSRVLKPRYVEYIIVMERMTSKRIHYHLLVVMAEDIRTGFDFVAVQHGNYQSASVYLRSEWKFWRETAPKYGFGRTELLPIRKTAEGVAKYIGKYIAKHIGQRLPEDKGARLVRYSKRANRVNIRFGWNSAGSLMWREKLGAFCQLLRLTPDNYKDFLREWFGRNWIYHLRPLIVYIKLPEFYSQEESHASLRHVWIVASNERERRRRRKRNTLEMTHKRFQPDNSFPTKPAYPWATWIERTIKEDEL
jgi:hypothetical protein